MGSSLPPHPPPYTEEDYSKGREQDRLQVNRKPVPTQTSICTTDDSHEVSSNPRGKEAANWNESIPPLPPRRHLSLETAVPPILSSPDQVRQSSAERATSTYASTGSSALSHLPSSSISSVSAASTASSKHSTSSYFQNAYREARHFAGGLITHPVESTKHFSILRHSHGLVFYRGPGTSLAISIFADSPLPSDRTLWLQSKGWTGKTGMRAKAFIGRNGNWLNVTPTMEIGFEQLNVSDERAWQRDIASFRRKAQPRIRENHILRETVIVRIPAEAEDGYFQIVLCTGDKKKVLCPSPVFRVLSTSRSPSSIRGASLSTLPLELGAMALGTYASNTVGRVISPVTSTLQSSVQQYMPSWRARQAVETAYGMSGIENRVNSMVGDENNQDDLAHGQSSAVEEAALEHGPTQPYPIRFLGRVQTAPRDEVDQSTLPSVTLSGVDGNVMQRLYGYYFGWVRLSEKSSSNSHPWCQATISALPVDSSQLTRVNITEANKRVVTIRLITEDKDMAFDKALLEILIMGFIRPDEPVQRAKLFKGLLAGDEAAAEAAMLSEVEDVSIVQTFLDHPSWSPDSMDQVEKTNRLDKARMTFANTSTAAQKQINRVPLHKLGIRSPQDNARDKMIITNGFFVPRG